MMLLPVPGTTTGGLTWPPFSAGFEEASAAVDVCMEVGVKVQSAGERPRVLTLHCSTRLERASREPRLDSFHHHRPNRHNHCIRDSRAKRELPGSCAGLGS